MHEKSQRNYQFPYGILLSFCPSFQGHVYKLLSTLRCWYLCVFFAVLFWSGIRKIGFRLSYTKTQQKMLGMAAKGKYDESTHTWLLVQAEGTEGPATCSEHPPAPVRAMCSNFCCAGSWEGWGGGSGGVLEHPPVPLQDGVEMGLGWGCPDQGREKHPWLVIQTPTAHRRIWPHTVSINAHGLWRLKNTGKLNETLGDALL